MPRLTPLSSEACSPEQRDLFDAIAGGDRAKHRQGVGSLLDDDGALRGPFDPWLRHPAFGAHAQRIGETLRFHGVLTGRQREVAILVVAAHWRARFEWWAHARIAEREGLPAADIDALARGEDPELADEAEAAVHAMACELLAHRRVSDATYERALERLGEQGVVEVVALMGYYSLVAMTLETFEVPLPPGERSPFDDG